MSVWEEVEAEFACSHELREVRYSVAANGARQWRDQCVRCGDLSQFLKYSHPRVMAVFNPLPVDTELADNYRMTIRLEAQRRITEQNDLDLMQRLREQDEEETRFWAEYNEYLKSGDWQARRLMVLKRDGYLCKACGQAPAVQAHHLTYKHGWDAPLFDLVAVCIPCHTHITALDREYRKRGYRREVAA